MWNILRAFHELLLRHRGSTMVTPHWPKPTSSWLLYTFMLWQHVLVLPTRAMCPKACICSPIFGGYVRCKDQELSEIPNGIPENTHHLDLSGNAIKTIDNTKLANLTNIESLNFRENQLTSLGPASLRGLRGLKVLILTENQISEIANTTFEETRDLMALILAKNRLTAITGMFRSLTNLDFLDLSFNQIVKIKEEHFTVLNSMSKLYLDGNLLGTVPFSLPPSLNKLKTLSLDDNNISELAANTFSKMKELDFLSLSQNAIRTLRGMTFTGLRSLTFLDLDSNPIETIEPQAFKGLKNLERLSLSNIRSTAKSNDTVIDPDVFNDMPKLSYLVLRRSPAIAQKLLANKTLQKGLGQVQRLYLENNGLETMPEDFRASVPYIRRLFLSKNPWRCDEDLRALRNWMQESSASHLFANELNVICASPENLKGKAVFTIDLDQFTRGTTIPLTTTPVTATQGIKGTARNAISSDSSEKTKSTKTTTNENISTKLPMDTSTDVPKSRSTNIISKPTTVSVNAITTVDNWLQSTQDNIEEESSHPSNDTPHVTSQKPEEQTNGDFDNDYIPIPGVDDNVTDDSETNYNQKGGVRQSFDSDTASSDISTINIIIITAVVSAVLLIIVIFTIAMLRYGQRKKRMYLDRLIYTAHSDTINDAGLIIEHMSRPDYQDESVFNAPTMTNPPSPFSTFRREGRINIPESQSPSRSTGDDPFEPSGAEGNSSEAPEEKRKSRLFSWESASAKFNRMFRGFGQGEGDDIAILMDFSDGH